MHASTMLSRGRVAHRAGSAGRVPAADCTTQDSTLARTPSPPQGAVHPDQGLACQAGHSNGLAVLVKEGLGDWVRDGVRLGLPEGVLSLWLPLAVGECGLE